MGTGRVAHTMPIINSTSPVSAPISNKTISPSRRPNIIAITAKMILKRPNRGGAGGARIVGPEKPGGFGLKALFMRDRRSKGLWKISARSIARFLGAGYGAFPEADLSLYQRDARWPLPTALQPFRMNCCDDN